MGAVQAISFSTGGISKQVEKQGKSQATKAIVRDYNKKLAKENCTYADATTIEPSCDLDKIISDLSNFHNAMEGTIARDINIILETQGPTRNTAWKRAEYIRDRVRNKITWWDWTIRYRDGRANEVKIQIQGS